MKHSTTNESGCRYPLADPYGALQMPVYQNVAFEFPDAESMELAFLGKTTLPTYSRIANPTVEYYEARLAAITGAASVTALSSGMAAITAAIMTIGYAGGNVITSRHLFGNTYSLLVSTLADFGVEVRLCDMTDTAAVAAAISDKTFALFLEVITNPQMEVADLAALSRIARAAKVPLVADTTMVPPTRFNAKQLGIDVEIISSTKYISGGATSLGGLVLDYATMDWSSSPKLSRYVESDYASAFTFKMKREMHRNLGAYMSPQAAALQTIGLDTMMLRYERAAGTCLRLAQRLPSLPQILSVNYPGLPANPYYDVCTKQFGALPCAMLTFDLESREHCFRFLNRLKVVKRATNLFDNKTLAIHPESTIYAAFSPSDKERMHVTERTIRLSLGLEDEQLLLEDIEQAL